MTEPPNGLTPTQKKLMDALADGKHHTSKELRALLDGCDDNNLRAHMSMLRTKVRQSGSNETIICEDGGYRRAQYVTPF